MIVTRTPDGRLLWVTELPQEAHARWLGCRVGTEEATVGCRHFRLEDDEDSRGFRLVPL